MEHIDQAFILSRKRHSVPSPNFTRKSHNERFASIGDDATPLPATVAMHGKSLTETNQEHQEHRLSVGHSDVSSVSSTASRQSQGRKGSNARRATHVNPYVQIVMKKKFKTADRKREEQLLNELSEKKRLDYLAETSHFSSQEVQSLALMFHALTAKAKIPNEMDPLLFKDTFRVLFDVTDDIMLDQIFYFFDADREGTISATEWIKNIGIILRGNLSEHCDYCFAVYDLNGDKSIGKSETLALIQHCMDRDTQGMELEKFEAMRDIAELVYRKLDPHGTGQVTAHLFRRAVYKDPLLLQCLGHCLPSSEKAATFLHLTSENWKHFQTSYSLPQFPSYS